jgi:hypothetical protein
MLTTRVGKLPAKKIVSRALAGRSNYQDKLFAGIYITTLCDFFPAAELPLYLVHGIVTFI